MPYANLPEGDWDKMDKCVDEVMAKGHDKKSAIAICYTSITGKSIDPHDLKIGARNSSRDAVRLQGIHDYAVENGAICSPAKSVNENVFKTISQTNEELRIGNYIVLFGGRDLTKRSNANGTKGEYFSKNTDLESEYTKSGMLHVDFEHGLEETDDDTVLGYVDWKTAQVDEKGVFVQRVLNRRIKYVQWLEELIKEGLVGNSTEAIRGKSKKTEDGEILKWPLKRDSLTVVPAEPRMLIGNALSAAKSLAEEFPYFKSLLSTMPEASKEVDAASVETIIVINPLEKEGTKMTELTQDEIKALIVDASKAAVEEYRKTEPAPKGPAIVIVTDEAEQPFKSAGEFFMAVKTAALYPNQEDRRLRPLKATGLNEAIPSQGGYLLAPTVAGGIVERMYKTGEILSRVASDGIGPNSNSMVYNAIDETSRADGSRFGGVQGYWIGEAAAKTASKPKFRQVTLKLKKVVALCYATDELLEDATALESWLNRTVPEELKFKVEDAFMNGDGVAKPLGILTSPCLVTVTRNTGGSILLADILGMWARRWAGVNDYVWLCGQDSWTQLPALTVATNFPAFMPPGGISGAPYGTIFGRPVIENEYSPALNAKGDIMLASLSQYQTITKGGIASASSIHVLFTYDETAFRFIYRTDGEPMWASALTPFNGGSTQSPFVVLGAASA